MGSHFSQMSPSGETSASHRVHTLPHIYTTPHRTCVTPLHTITSTQASLNMHKYTYEHMLDYLHDLSTSSYSFPLKKHSCTCVLLLIPTMEHHTKKLILSVHTYSVQNSASTEVQFLSCDFYKLCFSEFKTYNVTLS